MSWIGVVVFYELQYTAYPGDGNEELVDFLEKLSEYPEMVPIAVIKIGSSDQHHGMSHSLYLDRMVILIYQISANLQLRILFSEHIRRTCEGSNPPGSAEWQIWMHRALIRDLFYSGGLAQISRINTLLRELLSYGRAVAGHALWSCACVNTFMNQWKQDVGKARRLTLNFQGKKAFDHKFLR